MNHVALARLKSGEIDFEEFAAREGRNYLARLAAYFYRRAAGPSGCYRLPIDVEDLEQIGRLELWTAVREYRYRCPRCPRSAATAAGFVHHTARHGDPSIEPKPPLLRYVHARVGRSMDHEIRRYVRRRRFQGEVDFELVAMAPQQEAAAELALLVERARVELTPVRRRILDSLAFDGIVEGVSPYRAGKLRAEVRSSWLRKPE